MGEIIAVLATFAYALGAVYTQKESLSGVPSTNLAFSGVLISMFMTFLISGSIWFARVLYTDEFQVNTMGLFYFIIAGLLTVFFGRSFIYIAIKYLGALRIAALKNVIPFLSIILAIFILGESFTLPIAIGGIFIFSGLGLMVNQNLRKGAKPGIDSRNDQIEMKRQGVPPYVVLGYLYGMLAMIFYASGNMFRKLGVEYLPDPYFGAFIGAITGLVFFYFSALFASNYRNAIQNIFKTWRPNLWIAGAGISLGQLLLYVSLSYIELSRVSLIIATEAIVTIFMLRVLRVRETVTKTSIVACCIVLIGAFFILLF